jgi:hypothetical protein
VFQSRQLVKNNISHMNSSYFTEEHQLFREFKDFFTKEVVPHIEKWEKTGTIERFIWKSSEKWALVYIGGIWWVKFRFVLRDFSRRTSKIKSSGFAAAMWAHSYLAMTHISRR